MDDDDPADAGTPTDSGDYGFPKTLWRRLDNHPPPGLKRSTHWRSPLRGLWLTSVLGSVLLVIAADRHHHRPAVVHRLRPAVRAGHPGDVGWLKLPTFDWPTDPVMALPAEPGTARRISV